MSGIEVEVGDRGVATIWLNNPKHLNALTDSMIIACAGFLASPTTKLSRDRASRPRWRLLRGTPTGRREGAAEAGSMPSKNVRLHAKMNEVVSCSPHPVVSVIGVCARHCDVLVSWSDIALAEDGALFGYPEVHHGITPYGAVPTMLNTMSQKAMMDLLLTGRKISADEAVRLGIITRAVPADQLTGELDRVLEDIFRLPSASQEVRAGVRSAHLPRGGRGCGGEARLRRRRARDARRDRGIPRQAEGDAVVTVGDEGFVDIGPLLEPQSIAVIGASDQPGNLGGDTVRRLRKFKFPGDVWPINRTAASVADLRCYTHVSELPRVPELAIMAVPASALMNVIGECAEAGVRYGIAYAGGLADAGAEGAELQRAIGALCRGRGFILCGPNCVGVINATTPVTATFSTALAEMDELRPGAFRWSRRAGIATTAFSMVQQPGSAVAIW